MRRKEERSKQGQTNHKAKQHVYIGVYRSMEFMTARSRRHNNYIGHLYRVVQSAMQIHNLVDHRSIRIDWHNCTCYTCSQSDLAYQ